MDEDFLSPEEETAVESVKSAFYGSPVTVGAIKQLLGSFSGESRAKIIDSAVFQISAEQAQRRRYVTGALLDKTAPAPGQDEALVISYAQNEGDAGKALANLGLTLPTAASVPDEARVLEEAKRFELISNNLENFCAELILSQKVAPYFSLLNALSSEQLSALNQQVVSFLDHVQQGRQEEPLYNPELPKSLVEQFRTAKMGLSLGSLDSLGAKIQFLMTVYHISQAILENRAAKSHNDTDLQLAVARLLCIEGETPDFAI